MSSDERDQREERALDSTVLGCPMTYVCSKRWADMTPTSNPRVRFCAACSKPVTLCVDRGSLAQVASRGGCVALLEGTDPTPRRTLGLPASGSDRLRRYLDGL